MKTIIGNKLAFLAVLVCALVSFSQETYSQWAKYRVITVNTTSGGANVPGAVANFPLLVRLTSTQADVFSQALAGGADIRFTDSTGATRLKHQTERWDATGQAAEFWVLVPNVVGASNTAIRMYWGKSGVADSSRGTQVFSSANGFEAVYHMNETGLTTGGTIADATGNGHTGTAQVYGTGATAPGDGTDGIGVAKTFNGNNAGGTGARGGIGGYFTLADPNVEGSGLSLNTKNGPWTVSAWVKPTSCAFATNAATSGRYAIVGRYNGSAANKQWILQANNAANQWKANYIPSNLNTGVAGSEMSAITSDGCTAGAWQFLTSSYYSATDPVLSQAPATSAFYVTHNGTFGAAGVTGTNQYGTTARVTLGATDDSTRMMNGSIDEVIISKAQRDSNWIRLSYRTQIPGQTAVTLGSTQAPGTVSGTPTGVTAVAGNAQATVTWVAPSSDGGSAITGYTATSVADTSKHCATTGSLTCTITGLTNGTAYTFTVIATNGVGNSAASSPSSAVTPVAPPGVPGSPTGATATAGNVQATVSWTAPTSDGGSAITAYTVTSNPDSKTCGTTGALTCTVTALTNGTAYTFTVVATNSSGPSAASSPSVAVIPVTVPAAPTGATGAAGNAQVVVSWTASASTGGSAITAYTATSVQDTSKHCATTGTLTCTVTGLTNGTAYSFTVTAKNAVGTSAASTASTAVTPVTVPGAPTITTVVGASGQVTVTWTAPASTGGSVITGYVAAAVSDTSKKCTTTGTLTCVVTGLTNATTYTFTVTAINAVGTGTASAPSAPVTGILNSMKEVGFHISGTSMMLRLPELSANAEVSILDVWGRSVWNKTVGAGVREVSWQKGAIVPGVYIIRLAIQDASHKYRVAHESKMLLTP